MGKQYRVCMLFSVLLILISSLSAIASVEATEYEIQASLDVEAHTLVGTQRATVINRGGTSADEVVFALIANWGAEPNPYVLPILTDAQYTNGFDPTWTKVSHVKTDSGETLAVRLDPTPPILQTYSLSDGLLIVTLDEPLEPGQSRVLVMTFETKFAAAMAGDMCVYNDTYIWRFGWNPMVVGAGAAGGRFEMPAADYRVELSVPEEYEAFAGADVQEILDSASPEIKRIGLSSQHPVRSVPLVIGKQLEWVSTEWKNVLIEAVYLPGGESYARLALSYAEDILEYNTAHFGPYPGERIVISETPTPGFFGMAADGLVLVGSSAVRLKDMPALGTYDRVNEYLLAHELAHLWWGIGIGTDFNAENWISEGFAEYLSIGYFEDRYGGFDPNLLAHLQAGLAEDVILDTFGYLNLRQHLTELQYLQLLALDFDEPILQPMAESQYVNGQTIRTYKKGYLVLRALAAVVGEDTLRQVLLDAHQTWNGRILTVAEFQSRVEQASERDLSSFFDGWLRGASQLDIAVSGYRSQPTGSGYRTQVMLTGADPDFPVQIEAVLSDGSSLASTFVPDCCSAIVPPIDSALPVVSITIDPDELLPDSNRFNNHWPREFQVSHPFQSDNSATASMPLDAYVIDVSMAGISGSFRSDHAWSLIAMPHIDPDLDWDMMISDDYEPLIDIVGAFAAVAGRDLRLALTGTLLGLNPSTGEGELDMTLTAQTIGFTHPETGMAGQYWYPTWRHSYSLGVTGTTFAPIPFVALEVARDGLPSSTLRQSVAVTLGIPGFGVDPFGTATWRGAVQLRLAPLFTIELRGLLAETLFADLPDEFLFSLEALHSFDYLPMGHHQQYLGIEVTFPPLVRNWGYAIFNLTRIDSVIPSLVVHGGRTVSNCEIVCESQFAAEIGAKLTITFPGFLGSTMSLGIGYAHPLIGVNGEGRLYVDLGGGF